MTEQQQYPTGDFINANNQFQGPVPKYAIQNSNGFMQQENDDTFNMSDLGDNLPKQNTEIGNQDSNSKPGFTLSQLKLHINQNNEDDSVSKKSMSMEGSLFRQPLGSVGKYKNQKCDFRNIRNNSNNLEYSLGGADINSGMYLNDVNDISMHSKKLGAEKSDGMSQMSFDLHMNDVVPMDQNSDKKNGNYIQTVGRRQSMKPGTIQQNSILQQHQKRNSQILKQSDLQTIQEQQSPDIRRKPLSQQTEFSINQLVDQQQNNNNNNMLNNNNTSDSNSNSNNVSANNEDLGYKDNFFDNVCDQVKEQEARNDALNNSNVMKSDVGGDLHTIYSVNHDKHQFEPVPLQPVIKNKVRAQTYIAKKPPKQEHHIIHNNHEDYHNMQIDLSQQLQKRRKTYSSSDVNKFHCNTSPNLDQLKDHNNNNIANSQSDSEDESSEEENSPVSRKNRQKQSSQQSLDGQEGKKRKIVPQLEGIDSNQQKYNNGQYSHSLSPQKSKPRSTKKKYSVEQNGQYSGNNNSQDLLSLQPVLQQQQQQQQQQSNLDSIDELGQPQFMQYQFAQSMPDNYNMSNTSPLMNNNENLYSTQSSSLLPNKKQSFNSVNTDGNSPLKSQTRKNSNYRKEKRNQSSLYKQGIFEETGESKEIPYNESRSAMQSQSFIEQTSSTQQSQNSKRIRKKQQQNAGRKQKKEHIDTSHAPINIINLLTKHLLKIYKESIPCESTDICKNISTSKQTVDQILSTNLCQRCKEQSLIDEIKHSNRKNIENLAKFWQNSTRLQILSQDYLINNCPLKFVQKNYVDKNRKALIHCLPEFIKGNRRPHEFWKLQ